MASLEDVLGLIERGYANPKEIAKTLNMDVEEVKGMIRILESLGYVERVKLGGSLCKNCPLKRMCSGACIRFKGQIYQISRSGSK
ncbi:MAG TPA: DNA-binding protein [Thermococcus paralvinellae]|uniref:DNA-binding protein n=1 Tax=Thermococcus paralvinellae TaxID=582419 RepID=A0A832ZH55_9EURY|nr:DNA-binding protein [Thermococcus paralvinellae]